MDSLSSQLSSLNLNISELEELRNNYNTLFYHKNNNVDIPWDFYVSICNNTHQYYSQIDWNSSYTDNSTHNYKINLIKLFLKNFDKETAVDKKLEYMFLIFSNMLYILD